MNGMAHNREGEFLSLVSSFLALVLVALTPQTFTSNLKEIARELDCSSESLRKRVWTEFSNLWLGSSTTTHHGESCVSFFSPMVEALLGNPQREAPMIEALRSALVKVFTDETLFASPFDKSPMASSLFAPSSFHFSFGVPVPQPLQPPSLKDIKKRLQTRPDLDKAPAREMMEHQSLPDCINDEFEPNPLTSPFGDTLTATFAQLRCLVFWSGTLDSMAPAYKTAIWRVAKLFNEDFGTDHDVTNFASTIYRWSQEPLRYRESIKILFSAIGYLKNHGVLSQEFEWPDQTELYPMFHGELTTEREKRKLRRKKRRGFTPAEIDDIHVNLKPLKLSDLERSPISPSTGVHHHQNHSAFTPLSQSHHASSNPSCSDSDFPDPKRRRVSKEEPTFFASPDYLVPNETESMPSLTSSQSISMILRTISQSSHHSDKTPMASNDSYDGSCANFGGDETSDHHPGFDTTSSSSSPRQKPRSRADSGTNSVESVLDDDVMEVVSALAMIENES